MIWYWSSCSNSNKRLTWEYRSNGLQLPIIWPKIIAPTDEEINFNYFNIYTIYYNLSLLPEIYTLSMKLFLPDCHHLQKDIDSNDMLIKETKKNLREASAIIFSVTGRFDTTLLQYRRGTEDYSVKV